MELIDQDGYPTEEFLNYVRNYDFAENSVEEFLEVLFDGWYYGDDAYRYKKPYTDPVFKRRYRTLELHTLGWSGNEEVISALRENMYFFALYYRMHIVGGHFYFRIPVNHKLLQK